uniref:CCHC-type domain-containing protein n=1 Tax=Hordeum vulgare TaxID=4513 RepID=A0A5J6CYJ0_HORVU|nr:hypothetical protein 2 [Hordeum vulgare]
MDNIRTTLINAQKGSQSLASFFAHMRGLADELVANGKPLPDDELVSYILHGLYMDYRPLVSVLDAHVMSITLDELFSVMSNFDQRMALFLGSGGFKSSANAAYRGHGGSSRSRGSPRTRGKPSGGRPNNPGGWTSSNNNKGRRGGSTRSRLDAPRCQICGKHGYTAKDCW